MSWGALIAISWELWNRVFFRETKLITGKIQHFQRAIQGACRCEGGFGRSPVAQLEKMSCLERGVTQKRMKWKAVLSPVPLKVIGIGVFIDFPLIFLICWILMMFSSPFGPFGGWSIMVDLIPLGRGLKVSILGPKFGGLGQYFKQQSVWFLWVVNSIIFSNDFWGLIHIISGRLGVLNMIEFTPMATMPLVFGSQWLWPMFLSSRCFNWRGKSLRKVCDYRSHRVYPEHGE